MTSHIVISRDRLNKIIGDTVYMSYEAGLRGADILKLDKGSAAFVASLPSGWLPIDQAPKDGTFVTVGHFCVTEGLPYWHIENCKHEEGHWISGGDRYYACMNDEPTHFLPLIQPE